MGLVRRAAALVLALTATAAAAEVSVQTKGSHLDLAATATPLAEVLDRLARQIGMKVVYEGPAPRQLVTVTLKDRTPAEAVLSLLEGQGVNYALVSDESGAGVLTLLLAGTAPATATTSAAPSRTSSQPFPVRRPFGPPMTPSGEPTDSFDQEQDEATDAPPGAPAETGAEGFGPPATADPNNRGAAAVVPGQQAGTPPAMPQAPVQPFSASPFTPQPSAVPPPLGGVAGPSTTPAPATTPKPPQ